MAGDQEKLGAARADGVRGHLAVAQAGHQNRPGFGQDRQGLQGRRHRPGGPKGLLPVLGQLGQVQGEVGPLGFSQGGLPRLVQNIHPGEGVAKEGVLLGLYPRKAGGFLGGTLRQLLGFQGQINLSPAEHGHLPSVPPPDVVEPVN